MRTEYVYHGLTRLGYGFENPNHAAAVIACLVPFFWAFGIVNKNRMWRWAFWSVEASLLALLALTLSRGGALAVFLSLIFYWIISRRFGRARTVSLPFHFLTIRLVGLSLLALASGQAARFSSVVAGDASASNRVELWLGSLRLIAARPWTGWGHGNSGMAYMQWIQDPSVEINYGGLVNTYLEVAVELGLPLFSAACFLLVLPVVLCLKMAFRTSSPQSEILLGCASGLVGFSVACFFTSLWRNPVVLLTPGILGISAIAWITRIGMPKVLWNGIFWAACYASFSGVLICLMVLTMPDRSPWTLRTTPGGVVRFVRKGSSESVSAAILFLPDNRTLGWNYGKEIRRAMLLLGGDSVSFDICPLGVIPETDGVPWVFVIGRRAPVDQSFAPGARIWALFPGGRPPTREDSRQIDEVILPEYDELGNSMLWRVWAQVVGCRISVVSGLGQDLRPEWGPVMIRWRQQAGKEGFSVAR